MTVTKGLRLPPIWGDTFWLRACVPVSQQGRVTEQNRAFSSRGPAPLQAPRGGCTAFQGPTGEADLRRKRCSPYHVLPALEWLNSPARGFIGQPIPMFQECWELWIPQGSRKIGEKILKAVHQPKTMRRGPFGGGSLGLPHPQPSSCSRLVPGSKRRVQVGSGAPGPAPTACRAFGQQERAGGAGREEGACHKPR